MEREIGRLIGHLVGGRLRNSRMPIIMKLPLIVLTTVAAVFSGMLLLAGLARLFGH